MNPGTVLRLAPDLRLRLESTGHTLVDAPTGAVLDLGPLGLAVLARFSVPAPLGAVVDSLESDPDIDFAPAMGVLNMLLEESALLPADSATPQVSGWANPVEHARMLHDERRTGDYLSAVAATVRPGDVVVDIGTGSGVLAVAAARAGARRVYAVEASDIVDVAREVFVANGVDDVVTVIPGWSRHVELPERADVLVAEVIGNEPLEEEILETTLDARQRLLRPDARLVPEALTLLVRPVLVPERDVRQRALGPSALQRWHDLYGIDFSALLSAAPREPLHLPTEGEVVATWDAVGPAVPLTTIDLAAFADASVDASVQLRVDDDQEINALALTFTAELGGGVTHTLDPWQWPASSWATSVWMLGDPVPVPAGGALEVRYCRRVPGTADGLAVRVVPAPGP